MTMVEMLIMVGKQLLAVIGKLILDNGGTAEDLAKLKIDNTEEINRILSEEERIKDRVKAVLDKLPKM